jgi:hypothetical protein
VNPRGPPARERVRSAESKCGPKRRGVAEHRERAPAASEVAPHFPSTPGPPHPGRSLGGADDGERTPRPPRRSPRPPPSSNAGLVVRVDLEEGRPRRARVPATSEVAPPAPLSPEPRASSLEPHHPGRPRTRQGSRVHIDDADARAARRLGTPGSPSMTSHPLMRRVIADPWMPLCKRLQSCGAGTLVSRPTHTASSHEPLRWNHSRALCRDRVPRPRPTRRRPVGEANLTYALRAFRPGIRPRFPHPAPNEDEALCASNSPATAP